MQIILATSNKGKISEFQSFFKDKKVIPCHELLGRFDITENGSTFAENALIKAQEVFRRTDGNDLAVVSDDSGITVPALEYQPGIYSARYAGEKAGDRENLNKLISELRKRNIKRSPAYYTAAIAIVSKAGEYVVHGWMHGDVIDEARGEKGFGYDPVFIPWGFDLTLGELDEGVKAGISHRAQAVKLAVPQLERVQRYMERMG